MKLFRAPDVFWDVVEGQTVVCASDSGKLYTLNDIAAFLWDGCDDTSLDLLTARLAAAFPDQDPAQLAIDIERFVNSMLDKGLLMAT